MEWKDVTRRPDARVLRQFAGLCLLIGVGAALWRWSRGTVDLTTYVAGGLGLVIGGLGLVAPAAVRWVYSGLMVLVFPIGWTVSRVIIALMFFVLFTPIAVVFRLFGRDALRLRPSSQPSLWIRRSKVTRQESYLRQF